MEDENKIDITEWLEGYNHLFVTAENIGREYACLLTELKGENGT
jgi:hypothetical protein